MWYIWLPFSYKYKTIAMTQGWDSATTVKEEISLIRINDYTDISYLTLVF